jgi:hypothetical protein
MDMAIRSGAGPNSTVTLAIAQRVVQPSPGGAVGSLSSRPQKRQDEPSTTEASAAGNSTETATQAPEEAANSTSTSSDAATSTGSNSTVATQAPQQGGGQAQIPAATQLLLAPTFSTISSPTVIDAANGRIAAAVPQLDGEFIITMQMGVVPAGGAAAGAGSAGALGSQPAARSQPVAGTTMTMNELTSMMKSQANGNVLPVWEMMSALQAQVPAASPVAQRVRRARV